METIELLTLLFAILAAVFGVVSNMFVVIATARYKHLRTVTNVLLGTLAVFDILLVAVCNPMNLLHANQGSNFIPGTTSMQEMLDWLDMCDVNQGITVFATAGHVLCMLAITLDRIFYMLSCDKYRACASMKICCLVIVVMVILAAVFPAVAVGFSPKIQLGMPCWVSTRIKPIFNQAIWAPILAITMLNFVLFYVLFLKKYATKTIDDVARTSDETVETGQGDQVGNTGCQANLTPEAQSKLQLQITRAIAICIALFIPSYLTQYVILTLAWEHRPDVTFETWVFYVVTWVNNIYMCINPAVYVLVHNDYRTTFKRCFLCKSAPGTVQPYIETAPNNGTQQQ